MQVSSCWTERLDYAGTLNVLRDLALRHCTMAGPAGQAVADLLSKGDYAAVVAFKPSYDVGPEKAFELLHLRQALGFFQKLEDLDIGVDKENVAYERFLATEQRCRETNAKFRALRYGRLNLEPADTVDVFAVQELIRSIIGRAPSFGDLTFRFGPGATASIKRKVATAQQKLAEPLSCSYELLASGQFGELSRQCPAWFSAHETSTRLTADDESLYATSTYDVTVVPARLQFVPKNANTYRTITPQPTLNGFVQAGVGDFLMARLKRKGLDLYDQSKNRSLCRLGSTTQRLATVDLSSASDLISYQVVKFLLPDDWFDLVSGCRAGFTTYKGCEHTLEMFSAMGNFVTFPLESLIFWAIARVACRGPLPPDLSEVGVFGDDIIVPVESYERLVRLLDIFGLVVNEAKSFRSGGFRESCGADYFYGINIRPFYQKKLVSGRTLFTLHNFYVRNYMHEEASLVLQYIPESLRIFGPDGYGDGHLVASHFRRRQKRDERQRGYGGYYFASFSQKARFAVSRYPGDYVSPLYSIYQKGRDSLEIGLWSMSFSDPIRFAPDGRPEWALPGDAESPRYAKILIYTLGD